MAPSHVAWLTVALLWPVALLNYLDRQMLAAMKFSVMTDVPDILNDANWGYMLGQFKWVYAALSPIGGLVADRFGRRTTIAGSLAVWSIVTWATGQVTTYQELLWTRTLMGLSESFYIPAALALIADYHGRATRSRAVGLHQTAIYCGVILGGFAGYAADTPTIGWRGAFAAAGFVGLAYALPLALLLRDRRSNSEETTKEKVTPDAILHGLLLNRSFLILVLYFTLPAMAAWVIRDWMPAILKDRFAIGQGRAGVSATLFVNIAALAGVFLGGWLADQAIKRTIRGRIAVSAVGVALIVPALFGVGHAETLQIAVMFLMLFGLGWGFYDGNNMPILAQIVPPSLRATGYGVMNFISISCGGLADWGFGALRDRAVPLDVIFVTFAGLAVLAIELVIFIRPRPELSESESD